MLITTLRVKKKNWSKLPNSFIYIDITEIFKIWNGHGPHPYIAPPLDFGCSSREKKSFFCRATNNHRTITIALFGNKQVGCWLLQAGCQFHLYLPFGKFCGKVVYIFCGFIFQVKRKTININYSKHEGISKIPNIFENILL